MCLGDNCFFVGAVDKDSTKCFSSTRFVWWFLLYICFGLEMDPKLLKNDPKNRLMCLADGFWNRGASWTGRWGRAHVAHVGMPRWVGKKKKKKHWGPWNGWFNKVRSCFLTSRFATTFYLKDWTNGMNTPSLQNSFVHLKHSESVTRTEAPDPDTFDLEEELNQSLADSRIVGYPWRTVHQRVENAWKRMSLWGWLYSWNVHYRFLGSVCILVISPQNASTDTTDQAVCLVLFFRIRTFTMLSHFLRGYQPSNLVISQVSLMLLLNVPCLIQFARSMWITEDLKRVQLRLIR